MPMSIDELIGFAGGVVALARIAGVDHATVSATWRRKDRVPVERCQIISEALDIPLHELRPDIWRPPVEAA